MAGLVVTSKSPGSQEVKVLGLSLDSDRQLELISAVAELSDLRHVRLTSHL